ncbi:MAG: hypothetical protein HOU81_09540 [Hamadaea sp.]|uniref:hypothetical protein n=1 Tax=Hamadaea sp. TaxID=2024425 RepID=UPI0018285C7E|nr:hypothetical protein [Hamadaea sp.]NUR71053.1 hypothetical protein [Hamadaea sp.]NUT24002.1 hypothetical protein [Hamadaea sp.]
MSDMEQLTHRLQELADVAPSDAPTGRLLERGRRARHRRAAVTSASLAAVVALGTVGGVAVATSGTPDRPAATASATDPRLELVAAVTKSENISYRMRLTTATESGQSLMTYEGAFDPRTATGYVRAPQDDSVMVELLINGTRYIGGERPESPLPSDKGLGETYGRYGVYPGKYDHLSIYGDQDTVEGAAAPDPAALFKALKAVGATVTRKPDGTVHFAYAQPSDNGLTTANASGDVTFDADGRVAMVAMRVQWQSTVKGKLQSGTVLSTMQLSDYGLPVQVKRPTDVVRAN